MKKAPAVYVSVDYGTPSGDKSVIAIRRGSRKAKKVWLIDPHQFVAGRLTKREARGIVELLIIPDKIHWN